jgi:2-dehydro-3-deoxygluconokinase
VELVSAGPAIVSVGECMIELSRTTAQGEVWLQRYGGDTLNTAIYLSRLGEKVAYLTALGDDPYSAQMRQGWTAEGIDTSLVLTRADRLPGLYMIQTNVEGERSFHYWRENSAARTLFECEGIEQALARAEQAGLLYLTGITLSLFERAGRARLVELCHNVRSGGGRVAFDPNYRGRGWAAPEQAQEAFAAVASQVDFALPTFEDEAVLHGDRSPADGLDRWTRWGAGEVVVKMGSKGALVGGPDGPIEVPTEPDRWPRDTTGAGDGFNAAYLVARLRGEPPRTAAERGNRLAGAVVKQTGAIIPRLAMPVLPGLAAAPRLS